MEIKKRLYAMILRMILKDRVKLGLTGKQKSQVEHIIRKCE